MKISWMGFLGTNHSWSIVGQNICRALIKKNHDVHMLSTNGLEFFPNDLKPYLKSELDKNYDMQLSYTAMKNFPAYLNHGNKNRFGIWNYETTVLPQGFAKMYKYVDKMLPSSNFSKKVFLDAGIPDENMVVVPHGINIEKFNTTPYPVKTKKKFKILANIAQPHIRKNIPGLLEAFGKAFTKTDDVCLVLKISDKKQNQPFFVSFKDIFNSFKNKYKNHAEIEIINTFIDDIESLYLACDAVVTMTFAECFWMPGLEGMAANKLIIAPRYGGHLDYMNDENSLLIDGKEAKADLRMQYWTNSPYAKVFVPNIDHAVSVLKHAYDSHEKLIEKFSPNMRNIVKDLTWDNVADKILQLCDK